MKISVTDQRDRKCDWVCHVQVETMNGTETIYQVGGFPDETAAKEGAELWMREYCTKVLAQIASPPLTEPASPAEDRMREALEDCLGCITAAESEGLHEVIGELRGFSDQTDRLIDLVERRLLWVRNYAEPALTSHPPAGAETGLDVVKAHGLQTCLDDTGLQITKEIYRAVSDVKADPCLLGSPPLLANGRERWSENCSHKM